MIQMFRHSVVINYARSKVIGLHAANSRLLAVGCPTMLKKLIDIISK
jgi:hypothetical protein